MTSIRMYLKMSLLVVAAAAVAIMLLVTIAANVLSQSAECGGRQYVERCFPANRRCCSTVMLSYGSRRPRLSPPNVEIKTRLH